MESKFLYGAATSAHQVEGNNVNNDWWQFEQTKPPFQRSGRSVDHFSRFAKDFAQARSLGHNAHRLSLEWSRIIPRPGKIDRTAIDHYRHALTELKSNNLKSFVTLHHFTNPTWFAQKGGWEKIKNIQHFADYTKTISAHLGDLIDYWITINEPMVYATQSYWRHRWPPQKHNLLTMNKVIRNMATAHRQAYRIIKREHPQSQIGLAKHFIHYLAPNPAKLPDRLLNRLQNWWFNDRFYQLTGRTHDFIGVNYYFTFSYAIRFWPPKIINIPLSVPKSDLHWPIYPEGLKKILISLKKYKLPIYVTENGLADTADKNRPQYIRDHLKAVENAQQEGADVRGYLHWSLLDNFEWDLGFEPRFGLIKVDYKTMARHPRPSAYVYQAIINQASAKDAPD